MKRSTQILRSAIIMILTAVVFTSCVKKEYDDIETANVDPALTPTHTIKQLQALATGAVGVLINTDVIVAGIVVGDDASGNIYKKLVLQQDSSGISVQLDISNFNTEYPIGRRIFVKCKGLYIANNGGNFELGTSATNPVGRIPSNLADQYLVKGKWGLSVTPMIYPLGALNIPTNCLIKFDGVEFQPGDYGVAWAATSPSNLTLEDCSTPANNLIVYSSTFSTFALTPTPTGRGSIQGIYTIYAGEGELQIRDLYDVKMDGLRCNGSSGITTVMPIDSVRMLDPGAGNTTSAPIDRKIRGTVISNYSTAMITAKNIYIQDGTAAIQVRFSASNTFAVGTEIEINISGVEISTFSGVLQLNNVPLGNAIAVGAGAITPRTATIADINTNYDTWEGQLVKITGVTITGTGTYAGTNTLTDATGSMALFTTASATFASTAYPTGTVSVTGILTEFNGTKEILIRDVTDVQ